VLGADDDGLVVVRSSGTTGDPVDVPKDDFDSLYMWAVLRYWTARLGITLPPRPRVVLLCSLPGGLEYSVRLPLFHDGALHRLSIHHPRVRERISRARPSVVFTDPAGLHWLAAHSELASPRLLLSSAQHLAPSLRARFDAPLVNYYATTETGPIAWECLREAGRFHVLVPDVWVESVGGELVVSRLRPSAVPLLRYRTGDRGALVPAPCACGDPGPSIVGLSGRESCRFVTPSGALVDAWQLAFLFKHHALAAFRFVQLAPSAFRLELDESGDASALVAPVRAALARLGWSAPIRVDLGPLDRSARDSAKPCPFVCALEGDGARA